MKNRTILWIFLAFVVGFLLPVVSCIGTSALALGALSRSAGEMGGPPMPAGDAVAVIDLNGMIIGRASQQAVSPQQVITPDRVADLLEQAENLSNVKAVVLRVDSPGGSVVASDEIYHMLLDFEKPVVIWMGDTAASGGYYISCGGDYVFAHPDTLTGSIGVISQFINAEELLDEVGVDVMVITSGTHKDMGSLFRDMTEEEREIWNTILDQIYADFVEVVAESRELSMEQVRELADGRIYTGQQALENDLVDEVGLSSDAVDKAAELAGIVGEPQVIELSTTPSFLDMFYGFQSGATLPTWQEILGSAGVPSLEYRFVGP
jgi:protease-4